MNFYFYAYPGGVLAAPRPLEGEPLEPGLAASLERLDGASLPENVSVTVLLDLDPMWGRGSFRPAHPGQLLAGNGLAALDGSRLPSGEEIPETIAAAIREGRCRAVSRARPGWEKRLAAPAAGKRKRVHIMALGDVGSTILIGLKVLGAGLVDTIGIWDIDPRVCRRWETEMGQVSLIGHYDTFPKVETVRKEDLFRCDVFLFSASMGVPPVGSGVRDVRMAQYERNARLVAEYARMARAAGFQGLWAQVSDPVDPLARMAYVASNRDETGAWDGKGLWPEQVQGYGLGVMNARAVYYARQEPRFASFLTEGRSFGPHGQELVVANSVEHYDDALSRELTERTVTANLAMRELGFKPYVAPALSSAALSILQTIAGDWHCGSVFLDGIYMGVRNRYTSLGVETELLPRIPEDLFGRIEEAAGALKNIPLPD